MSHWCSPRCGATIYLASSDPQQPRRPSCACLLCRHRGVGCGAANSHHHEVLFQQSGSAGHRGSGSGPRPEPGALSRVLAPVVTWYLSIGMRIEVYSNAITARRHGNVCWPVLSCCSSRMRLCRRQQGAELTLAAWLTDALRTSAGAHGVPGRVSAGHQHLPHLQLQRQRRRRHRVGHAVSGAPEPRRHRLRPCSRDHPGCHVQHSQSGRRAAAAYVPHPRAAAVAPGVAHSRASCLYQRQNPAVVEGPFGCFTSRSARDCMACEGANLQASLAS